LQESDVRSAFKKVSTRKGRKAPAAKKSRASAEVAYPRWLLTCVLVADGGTARLLQAPRPGGSADGGGRGAIVLAEIVRLENAAAHLSGREMITDRTGRVFDSGGRSGSGPKSRARHGANSDYDPHDVEVERFARKVALRLDAERRRLGIEELVVIAGPRFLGALRQQIPAATRKVVTREIDSDLVHASDALIRRTAFAARR
jgi:protein required for attachment to host cells